MDHRQLQSEYKKSVEDALDFLMKKGTDEAINEMKEEMMKASENLEFEIAPLKTGGIFTGDPAVPGGLRSGHW